MSVDPRDEAHDRLALTHSYDRVADSYRERISGELKHKPLDRQLLDELAARTAGTVIDVGCGPGHVALYLHGRGSAVRGFDISPAMVAQARALAPQIRFELGDIRSLPLADGSVGGVAAMYSLIHLSIPELAPAAAELARVLRTGGLVLAAFHRGGERRRVRELWGHEVALEFYFYEPAEITAAFSKAGLEIERVIEREPYPDVEAPTSRFYVLAAKRAKGSADQADLRHRSRPGPGARGPGPRVSVHQRWPRPLQAGLIHSSPTFVGELVE